MKILCIGNSFSEDATQYLAGVMRAERRDYVKIVNLVIGGCSLARHYRNMLSEERAYALHVNGVYVGFNASLKEALLSDDWDVVTLQQASHFSAFPETYDPYVAKLASYIREMVPKARLCLHETWFYEQGSRQLANQPFETEKDMMTAVRAAYHKAAETIGADLIPCGDVMEEARRLGIVKLHRDGFHADLGAGRYLLALTFMRTLTGRDVSHNAFTDFDVDVDEKDLALVRQAVMNVMP